MSKYSVAFYSGKLGLGDDANLMHSMVLVGNKQDDIDFVKLQKAHHVTVFPAFMIRADCDVFIKDGEIAQIFREKLHVALKICHILWVNESQVQKISYIEDNDLSLTVDEKTKFLMLIMRCLAGFCFYGLMFAIYKLISKRVERGDSCIYEIAVGALKSFAENRTDLLNQLEADLTMLASETVMQFGYSFDPHEQAGVLNQSNSSPTQSTQGSPVRGNDAQTTWLASQARGSSNSDATKPRAAKLTELSNQFSKSYNASSWRLPSKSASSSTSQQVDLGCIHCDDKQKLHVRFYLGQEKVKFTLHSVHNGSQVTYLKDTAFDVDELIAKHEKDEQLLLNPRWQMPFMCPNREGSNTGIGVGVTDHHLLKILADTKEIVMRFLKWLMLLFKLWGIEYTEKTGFQIAHDFQARITQIDSLGLLFNHKCFVARVVKAMDIFGQRGLLGPFIIIMMECVAQHASWQSNFKWQEFSYAIDSCTHSEQKRLNSLLQTYKSGTNSPVQAKDLRRDASRRDRWTFDDISDRQITPITPASSKRSPDYNEQLEHVEFLSGQSKRSFKLVKVDHHGNHHHHKTQKSSLDVVDISLEHDCNIDLFYFPIGVMPWMCPTMEASAAGTGVGITDGEIITMLRTTESCVKSWLRWLQMLFSFWGFKYSEASGFERHLDFSDKAKELRSRKVINNHKMYLTRAAKSLILMGFEALVVAFILFLMDCKLNDPIWDACISWTDFNYSIQACTAVQQTLLKKKLSDYQNGRISAGSYEGPFKRDNSLATSQWTFNDI